VDVLSPSVLNAYEAIR